MHSLQHLSWLIPGLLWKVNNHHHRHPSPKPVVCWTDREQYQLYNMHFAINNISMGLTLTVGVLSVSFSRISIKPCSEIWKKEQKPSPAIVLLQFIYFYVGVMGLQELSHITSAFLLPFLLTVHCEPFAWDGFPQQWPFLASPKQGCLLQIHIFIS